MNKPVVLVTGANGQLGKELQAHAAGYSGFQFIFLSREDLPIHHFPLVRNFFDVYKPVVCINAAAYTAVDRAEAEKELAFLINGEAVGHLAALCKEYGTRFIHISTDYVFDGQSPNPYRETDPVAPINVYGASKLDGEIRCRQNNPDALVLRTSWVYSEFGSNFVKTMLRLMKEKPQVSVVSDQIGAPTYAADLAQAILEIISKKEWQGGLFHYANKGRISWYDFAIAIKELSGSHCEVVPIPTTAFPTPARRPSFSLLDTTHFSSIFGISIPDWKESLRSCLKKILAGHSSIQGKQGE
jgi:dTDP-4-dehydrorhamnose reductase